MEKCLLDLLMLEKDCVVAINRSKDRIDLLKSEIMRINETGTADEWMARDIAITERLIAQEENEEVMNKVRLSNIRHEITTFVYDIGTETQDQVDSFPNYRTFEKDVVDVKLMLNRLASAMEDVLEGKLDDEESPETPNEESARIFCDAIKTLASKPENLDNLRSYLSHHFDKWLSKYGSSPENISCELRDFADMEI